MRFILLTGLSGSGKTNSLRFFEEMGCPYVDNLPPAMVLRFIELCEEVEQRSNTVIMAVDIRSGEMFDAHSLRDVISAAHDLGKDVRVLFLEATDDVLLNRFKETRREHPLMESAGSLPEAIAVERERLQPIREMADIVVDTTSMRPKALKEELSHLLSLQRPEKDQKIRVHLMSFGFKRGLPREADLVLDVRFLPNPFYVEAIRLQTGLEEGVRNYVLDLPDTQTFMDKEMDLLRFLLPHYQQEGKRQLVIAVGCTGGAHRSVAISESFGQRLREDGYDVTVRHRDIELEKENWKHL